MVGSFSLTPLDRSTNTRKGLRLPEPTTRNRSIRCQDGPLSKKTYLECRLINTGTRNNHRRSIACVSLALNIWKTGQNTP
jgi:hypothetical protein